MTKESIIKQLPEIKKIIQMAFEDEVFGRMKITIHATIALQFYASEEKFLREKDADLVLVMNIKDDKWSATQYGITSYGTQTNPVCEYGNFRIGGTYDDPITAAKEIVKLLNE